MVRVTVMGSEFGVCGDGVSTSQNDDITIM